MLPPLELQLADEEDGAVLRSPDVGLFTCALPKGSAVAPGEVAGVLTRLAASFELRVPPGAHGVVVSDPPALVRAPVGFGDVLYRLGPASAAGVARARPAERAKPATTAALVLRAPQGGRFYHRSAPGEPPFVAAGTVVEDGQPVGMIEVMKTFSHVTWRATEGVTSARVVKLTVADGADVKSGDVLVELEPER